METGPSPFPTVPPVLTPICGFPYGPILFSAICDSDPLLNPISIYSFFPSLVMCYHIL